MKLLLAGALLLFSMHAHGMLFCWNSANNTAMTYESGVFTYQLEDGTEPPPVVSNPGPQLLPGYWTNAYCWANGPELSQVFAALPDLRYPLVTKGVFRKSIQPGATSTVYWTGDDAWSIINNF